MLAALLGVAVFGQDPVPGFEFMLAGYDIRNASTKAVGDLVKSRIFLATFDDQKKSKRPNTTKVYLVPDQFDLYWYSTKHTVSSSEVHHQVDSYLHEEYSAFKIGIGFSMGVWGVMASYSRATGYVHQVFKDTLDFAAFGLVERATTKYTLGPYPLLPRSSFFDRLLKTIPVCPKTSQDLFNVQTLLDTYGQVFPTSLFSGGRFSTVTTLRAKIVDSKDISWITQQLSLKFYYDAFALDSGGFKNRSDIKISQEFLNQTKTEQFFSGGKYQDNRTLTKWFDSLLDIPAIVNGDFRPLSDLIVDDATKRKNIEALVAQHINKGKVSAAPCALTYMRSTEQLPPIPGYEFIGGFDSRAQEPRAAIFDHPFENSDETWQNPFYPKYKYAVPRTAGVFDNPESVDQNYTYVATSSTEFQQELRTHVTYKDHGVFSSGSRSTDLSVFVYYHDQRKEVMSESTRLITWYDVVARPSLMLHANQSFNSYFKQMLARLGTNMSDPNNKQRYVQFLNIYGDQVVTKVSMGVRISQKSYISESELNATSVTQFKESSHRSFLGIFGSQHDFDTMTKSISADYKAKTRVEVFVEGGLAGVALDRFKRTPYGTSTLLLKDLTAPVLEWRTFVVSAKDNLQPISYEVTPIADFISDPVIKKNMLAVVKEYQQGHV